MKPFFQHLRIALIAIIVASPAIAEAQPKLEIHRVGATADDGSGWHLAVSSKGSFSVLCRFLQRFHDERRHDGRDQPCGRPQELRRHQVFPRVELGGSRQAAAGPRFNSKIACGNAGQQGVGRQAQHQGEADILTLTMANTTTTLYMHCIQLGGARYILSIEFPNATASWSLPTKTSSSNPSNSRRNPDPGRSGSLTGL